MKIYTMATAEDGVLASYVFVDERERDRAAVRLLQANAEEANADKRFTEHGDKLNYRAFKDAVGNFELGDEKYDLVCVVNFYNNLALSGEYEDVYCGSHTLPDPKPERKLGGLTPKEADAFIARAREQYGEEGSIEVDDEADLSVASGKEGAYVAGWLWVEAV